MVEGLHRLLGLSSTFTYLHIKWSSYVTLKLSEACHKNGEEWKKVLQLNFHCIVRWTKWNKNLLIHGWHGWYTWESIFVWVCVGMCARQRMRESHVLNLKRIISHFLAIKCNLNLIRFPIKIKYIRPCILNKVTNRNNIVTVFQCWVAEKCETWNQAGVDSQ